MAVREGVVIRGGSRSESALLTDAAGRAGMLLAMTATGYRPHNVAGGAHTVAVLDVQHENQGADIDDTIAQNDKVTVVFPEQGAEVQFLTSDTISRGDWVESDGSGGVRVYGSGYRIGQASAASDLSGTYGRVTVVVAPTGV